ncbi:arylalkylamine N-acetyltransferase-like 2 [Cochliomyia hominivorax]
MLSSTDIKVRVIKPQDYEKVLDFLRIHFYRDEPLTLCGESKQQDKEDEEFSLANINHGTSVMAFLEHDNNEEEIVGTLTSGPRGPNTVKYLFKEVDKLGPTKWGKILKLLAVMELEANIYERFNVQKVLHLQVLAVHAKRRGQNIGYRMIEEVINIGKRMKFEMVSVDCTSFYSARLIERMGFECLIVKYYKDYKDETGSEIFEVDKPHECAKTFVFKL